MFFSDELLTSKKGTYGVIWLASTLGPRTKRISRKQLVSVDLSHTCRMLAEPPEPMALRLSGTLLFGVARVYNQNYEIFYTDVTHFYTNLTRSISTEYSSATGASGSSAGSVGLDLPGGGKSKVDQITFAGVDLSWEANFDFAALNLNWKDPLHLRKRRASSKLSSLASQQSQEKYPAAQGQEGDDAEEDEDEDDEDVDAARAGKRARITFSPALGTRHDPTRLRPSMYEVGSARKNLFDDIELPIGEEFDLGLDLDNPGDFSFSEPSGRGFDLAGVAEMDANIGGDVFDMSNFANMDHEISNVRQSTPQPEPNAQEGNDTAKRGSAKRQKVLVEDSEGSEGEERAPKGLKKLPKRLRFDNDLELADDVLKQYRLEYGSTMDMESGLQSEKQKEKDISSRADKLVASAGAAITFFDENMDDLFATLAHVPVFKWEQHVADHKAGKTKQREDDDAARAARPPDVAEDVFGPIVENPSYMEVYHDYQEPVHSRPNRLGSEVLEVELARRASQNSQQAPLPWEDISFGISDTGFPDFPGSGMTPQLDGRRLSIMTPQEQRLRRQGSINSDGSLNRFARASSVLGDRAGSQARMLVADDELELPADQHGSQEVETQEAFRDVPLVFRPESLAKLEKQCRDFFSFVERRMVADNAEQVDFDQLVPETSTKRVAAHAFYNCLTLAAKGILEIVHTTNEPKAFDPFSVRFTIHRDATAAA